MTESSASPAPASNPAAATPLLADDGTALAAFLEEEGEPRYRAGQIRQWIFEKTADSFDEMTNLSVDLRQRLAERFRIHSCSIEEKAGSDDHTRKLLVRLDDGEIIESVLIGEGQRQTACVSTQVGCPVGCPFCASGLDGTRRNLRAHEIVEQILLLEKLAARAGGLTHLVFMGIGEPLLNFENLQKALETLNDEKGLAMAARRITLSTVGPKGKIRRLAEIPLPINLAISLHAPNDALRDRLVPGNAGVEALVDAASRYRKETGRQVTFEYVLLRDVNASAEHARELARLVRGTDAAVNLIPFNPVPGTGFQAPTTDEIHEFRSILERANVAVTIRKRKGRSIDAACGQLRLNRIRNEAGPANA